MYMTHLEPDLKDFTNLIDLLTYRAARQATKTCVNFLDDGETVGQKLSYQELDSEARLIAAHLQISARQGERALLLYPPGIDFIKAFFGCLYAGVIAVPAYLPDPLRLARLSAIAENAEPSFILTTSTAIPLMGKTIKANPLFSTPSLLSTDNLKANENIKWNKPAVCKESLAFLQYTSGSTGSPKGAMITHENLIHNLSMITEWYTIDADHDHCVSWLPPYHDMGLIGGILEPVFGGFGVTLMSPDSFLEKPFRWLKAVSRYKATITGGPNFAYDLCARKITSMQLKELDLSHLKLAVNGAEPIRSHVLERFTRTFKPCGFKANAFAPSYGLAENTLLSASVSIPDRWHSLRLSAKALENHNIAFAKPGEAARDVVCCGQVRADQQIEIVDPDTHSLSPPNTIGEIWISGQSKSIGYWNQSELSKKVFLAEISMGKGIHYLRTGDLGFKYKGLVYVTGRLKDVIIIHGRNHYPQDIELTVEQSHPALRQGCGAAFSTETNGEEQLVIVQEVIENAPNHNEITNIVKAIRKSVSEQHQLQVHAVVLLRPRSIPKTSSGKIQRHACRDYLLNDKLDSIHQWQKRKCETVDSTVAQQTDALTPAKPLVGNCVESWLVRELSEKLQIHPNDLDLSAPLITNGLDSLLIAEIQAGIYSEYGVDLPVAYLVGKNSICDIGKKIIQLKDELSQDALDEESLLEDLDNLSEEALDALLAQTK